METKLRGVFLTSENPEKAAKFYQQVAALPIDAVGTPETYVYWRLDLDGVQLSIHDAQAFASYTHPALRESNLTHLYFQITEQKAFLAHLDQLGIAPSAVDDVVVTVIDPDGRHVMFGTA
ncbi:VOC family protein [Pelagibacterium limicola]|uniref:VOC family protein n=1 Tax=Pelagibacterium limicola TaxID=2791022 RepID=UPI0018AF96B2|nr:VOC family protein [Pelagibacterium limicola]